MGCTPALRRIACHTACDQAGEGEVMFHVPEKFRLKDGPLGSDSTMGNNGAFILRNPARGLLLRVIASDGEGWEHVSVSCNNRTPRWAEMCHVKALFWGPEDMVLQFHPPESAYVNFHPYTLHLWRPIGVDIPRPPSALVGPSSNP
jgi:hypothetical protein